MPDRESGKTMELNLTQRKGRSAAKPQHETKNILTTDGTDGTDGRKQGFHRRPGYGGQGRL